MLLFTIGTTLIGILLAAVVLESVFSSTTEREPDKLRSPVPLVGHLIGILKRHTGYFNDLYQKCGMAIATLPMPGGKIYAIWDLNLIQSGLTNKAMSFNAIMIHHAQGLLGLEDASIKIAEESLLEDLMHVTKPLLAGQPLAEMSAGLLNHACHILDDMLTESTFVTPDFYDWVLKIGTLATTEALYGEKNPISKDPSLMIDVWLFESGLRRLAMNLLPGLTARQELAARDRLVASIKPLFEKNAATEKTLPRLTAQRLRTIRDGGITDPEQIARIELALLHGATVNTIPTLFWTLVQVLARPELVQAIRQEALPYVSPGDEITVPIKLLDTSMPLLTSTYREATRLANSAMSTRFVMSDATLKDLHGHEYTFPAGSTVLMPASSHMSLEVWGPDVDQFKPRRFYDWDRREKPEFKKRRQAYMPFGGGKHLCPGRNLAKFEILGLTLALVLTFDVEDANKTGRPIRVPELEAARMGQGVGKPAGEAKMAVKFTVRKGWEKTKWSFIA
ncbi:cytochrome P450 [Xylariaceae sp. FL0255]|nr:cytochrome P450 [Xylariaceae sp. FL0255]